MGVGGGGGRVDAHSASVARPISGSRAECVISLSARASPPSACFARQPKARRGPSTIYVTIFRPFTTLNMTVPDVQLCDPDMKLK